MATRSNIGLLREDGMVDLIYCHFDGYPGYVGRMLAEYYNSEERMRELIDLGDISSLNKRVAPFPNEVHSFEDPADGVVVAYGRDRGEENTQFTSVSLGEAMNPPMSIEWVYIYAPEEDDFIVIDVYERERDWLSTY